MKLQCITCGVEIEIIRDEDGKEKVIRNTEGKCPKECKYDDPFFPLLFGSELSLEQKKNLYDYAYGGNNPDLENQETKDEKIDSGRSAIVGFVIFFCLLVILPMIFLSKDEPAGRYAPIEYTQTFNGYECTENCGGHEAGYDWAREKGITDSSDCGGESDSFIEGCQSYVQEIIN